MKQLPGTDQSVRDKLHEFLEGCLSEDPYERTPDKDQLKDELAVVFPHDESKSEELRRLNETEENLMERSD